MADNKSSEGKLTTLECMECGYREVFSERQFRFTDGLSCYVCNGPVQRVLTRPGEPIRNRRMKKSNELSKKAFQRLKQDMRYGFITKDDLKNLIGEKGNKSYDARTITVGIDCSDALKGLKAVQREARKTAAALKEVEELQKIIVVKGTEMNLDPEIIKNLHKDGDSNA